MPDIDMRVARLLGIVSVYVKRIGVQETEDNENTIQLVGVDNGRYPCRRSFQQSLYGTMVTPYCGLPLGLVDFGQDGWMKRSALKRNPAAIRDWVQASRKPLKPVGHKGKIKLGETVGPMSPQEWRYAVWSLCNGTCIMTGQRVLSEGNMFEWQAHHPLKKSLLAPEVRYDPRNGVVLIPVVHMRHENAFERVPLEKLPDSCMEFAEEQGSWAVEALLRAHPRENES